MTFDERLAERIRRLIHGDQGISERKMFGGLCFMTNGNMCFGIVGNELMLRVGVDAYEETLAQAHVREMDFTGRSIRGMVYITQDGISEDENLSEWLRRGLDHAGSLPPK